jgi:site-specific DNA-cytosine methylase
MLGIISGVGSMMVSALDDDKKDNIEVVGNYEWRKYYNSGTFERNFNAPLWDKWENVPEEAKQDIDIVMSHPECGNFSILQKDLSKRTEENDIGEFVEHIAEIKPKFFLMDNLYPSLAVYPASFYQEMLPEYDVFFEFVSNYHYGNVQKNRKRLFLVGARKELKFTFMPGEEEYIETVRTVIGDLPLYDDIPEIQHVHVDPDDEAEGWHLPGLGKDAPEGVRGYYTYGELAKRFIESGPGKGLTYLSKKAGVEKIRLGYFRLGWDQHGYVLHGGSPSRYHGHFHPETGMPLTVRERARIQGFPDHFQFVLPEKWAHLGIKQTGKAMPVEFCRFATEQFIEHLEQRGHFEPTCERFANIPDLVSEEKENYCKTTGYSDQGTACDMCWKARDCETRNKMISETFFEF